MLKKLKPDDPIMQSAMKIERFLQTHNADCWVTVLDFLPLFQGDGKAQDAVEYLVDKHKAYRTEKSKRVRIKGKGKAAKLAKRREAKSPIPVGPIGKCPRCDGWVFGLRLPTCETEETGRAYYKACGDCSYYSEIFVKDKKFIEIEGGE